MSWLPKDMLVNSDSDIDEIEPGSVGKMVATSSEKGMPCEGGTKRTCTSCSLNHDTKAKRKKSTVARCSDKDNTMDAGDKTLRDVKSDNKMSVLDLTPLNRDDIPMLISAVLQSIRSSDTWQQKVRKQELQIQILVNLQDSIPTLAENTN